MIIDNFFSHNAETSWFDECKTNTIHSNKKVISTLTSSISTTLIDTFRQGVEITDIKHHDAGICKIFSGEQGHSILTNNFGCINTFRFISRQFVEMEKFNPVTFISLQDDWEEFYKTFLTYPIVVGDYEYSSLFDKNGIIEPLTIRDDITLMSNRTEFPIKHHSFIGNIMNGNIDNFNRTDIVTSYDYFSNDTKTNYFLDLIESFANKSTVSYISENQSFIQPFNDIQIIQDFQQTSPKSQEIIKVLTQNSYKTNDVYIKHNQISKSTGFMFDSVEGIGTDSIAFGGLTY